MTNETDAGATLGRWLARQLKLAKPGKAEPLAPRERKIRRMWLLTFGIGGLLGAAIVFSARQQGHSMGVDTIFSSVQFSPGLAVALLALLVVTTLITIWYYRMIDEHEMAAQAYSSTVGFNVYALLTLAWWVAARGGLARPVDAMAIFCVVIVVWTVVWAWRHYR